MSKMLLADTMRELTASAQYRKGKAAMMKLQREYSTLRHIMLFKPDAQTIEMFENEGFKVERTKIVEYEQYKVSW